jgi:hypothetical protein
VIDTRLSTDVPKEHEDILESHVEAHDAGCGYARLIIRHQTNCARVVKPANKWHTRFRSLRALLVKRGNLRDDSTLVGWILAAVRTPSCTRPSLPAVA